MKIRKNSAPGVALIIVLGFLVIISALTVAFFSSVNTELKASRNFAAGITTRQLADSAVQLIMGQISSATTRGIDASGVGHEAWASQPGMIRVFGTNSGGVYKESDVADAFFKLYSSDKMIVSGGDLAAFNAATDYSNTWDQSPAFWTDLNAPVIVRDVNNRATPRFPIIDPRAYAVAIDPVNPVWNNNVEGFYYDVNAGVHGVVGPGNSDDQRLPMPVKWIYVLQDGTLTTPDAGGAGTTATFDTAPAVKRPSATNPIVGRVAFWTDDETCKLNLNTAAGHSENLNQLNTAYQNSLSSYAGSYWDTPRFYTQFEYGIPGITGNQQNGIPDPSKASGGLALCQLLQNEFQRYPGHPATTSLAPVFKNLLTSEQIYAITPRYSGLNLSGALGSTQGGTTRIIVDPINTPGDLDNKELQPKTDRLYATLDELLFAAHVKDTPSDNPGYARVPINTNVYPALSNDPHAPINAQLLDSLRFFVTTQSRAPELNLFGQPRVSCWPVRAEKSNETTGMNVFDNLILFCSTVGTPPAAPHPETMADQVPNGAYRYIFVRREVTNPTGNLGTQTRVDFLGDSQKQVEFTSTYTPDWKYTRNTTLLSTYLYGFLQRSIPGVGKKFVGDKWTNAADAQGVLTEIFDYIRLANSQDTTTSQAPPAKAIKFAPAGYVTPSLPTPTGWAAGIKGFGRMSTICEASLVFYYAGPQMDPTFNPGNGYYTNAGWSHWDPVAPSSRYVRVYNDGTTNNNTGDRVYGGYMRAFLVFSTFDPMQGYAPKADPAAGDPKLSIECQWQNDFQVDTGDQQGFKPIGFPTGAPVFTTIYRAPGSTWGGRNTGGYEGFMHTMSGAGTATAPYKTCWLPGPLSATTTLTAADYGETWVPTFTGTYSATSNHYPFLGQNIQRTFTSVASSNQEYYPFQSIISKARSFNHSYVPNIGSDVFNFKGGNITVKLYYGSSYANATVAPALQTFTLTFPDASGWPIPKGAPLTYLQPLKKTNEAMTPPTRDPATWLNIPKGTDYGDDPSGTSQGATLGMRHFYWVGNGCFFADAAANVRAAGGTAYKNNLNFLTSLQASWSLATRLAWVSNVNGDSADPHTNSSGTPIDPGWYGNRWRCIFQPGDTIRSLLYWDGNDASGAKMVGAKQTRSGDLRVAAVSSTIPATQFMPHPDYDKRISRACVLRGGDGTFVFPVGTSSPAPVLASGNSDATQEATLGNHIYLGANGLRLQPTRAFANLPWGGGSIGNSAGVNGVMRTDSNGQYPGDFDSGMGDFPDGPFLNKQDEGNVIFSYVDSSTQQKVFPVPYFTSTWAYQQPGNTFTSPSRQMPSPAMFGSLPAYPVSGNAWTTLSFSPVPAGDAHPGNISNPKDHYLLDLFQMPVVEPFPISEPFSTAGKVNLNYRIAPFDYIRRSTALRGALYPLRLTAVASQYSSPSSTSNYLVYKTGTAATSGYPSGTPLTTNFRLRIDRNETMKALDGFFDSGLTDPNKGFFRSATQICERYFYSQDSAPMKFNGVDDEANTMRTWWNAFGDLTGDNVREKPYVDLYPRICTKSNTYTVHMKVQTLRQTPGHPTQWIEGKDSVLGEYRGSATIERYLESADPRFNPRNAGSINPDTKSLEPIYRFRTVYSRKFTP